VIGGEPTEGSLPAIHRKTSILATAAYKIDLYAAFFYHFSAIKRLERKRLACKIAIAISKCFERKSSGILL
jgi:hypothetical protein